MRYNCYFVLVEDSNKAYMRLFLIYRYNLYLVFAPDRGTSSDKALQHNASQLGASGLR